ncbi:MAG: hypothetical protein J6Z11_00375, partial [Candidatus Riflebacteria bacterium]|nr:hypothetical protein [Candidatus Riflebacteria bacterium]
MKSGREVYLQFFRYFHTLKNFKLSQIISYISFKHRRKKLTFIDTNRVSLMADSLKQNFKLEESQKNICFCFNNYPLSLSTDEMKWEQEGFDSRCGEYWIKQLNSFDYINSEKETSYSLEQVSFLILDWISKNKNERADSWEPYTLSKRVTSWSKWVNNNKVSPCILSIIKLYVSSQLKRLFVDFEYHKPANHLIENMRGFLSGCLLIMNSSQYFNNELEYQLEQVLDEALIQINIQILEDGGHFERSPMYHSLMLEAIKDIKELSIKISKLGFLLPELLEKSDKLTKLCEEKIKKMSEWLEALTMSDGNAAQFNDGSRINGLKHSFEELTKLFEPSGFFVKHESEYSFIVS